MAEHRLESDEHIISSGLKPEDTVWKLPANDMGSAAPEKVGGEAEAKPREPFFLAKMYTCRCGYCGATEGMVDPNEVCSASTPDEMHPHRFGVFEALAPSNPVEAGPVGDMGPRSCAVCGEHYSIDDGNIECPFCRSAPEKVGGEAKYTPEPKARELAESIVLSISEGEPSGEALDAQNSLETVGLEHLLCIGTAELTEAIERGLDDAFFDRSLATSNPVQGEPPECSSTFNTNQGLRTQRFTCDKMKAVWHELQQHKSKSLEPRAREALAGWPEKLVSLVDEGEHEAIEGILLACANDISTALASQPVATEERGDPSEELTTEQWIHEALFWGRLLPADEEPQYNSNKPQHADWVLVRKYLLKAAASIAPASPEGVEGEGT